MLDAHLCSACRVLYVRTVSSQNGGSGMGFFIVTPTLVQSLGSTTYGLLLYIYSNAHDVRGASRHGFVAKARVFLVSKQSPSVL